MRIELILFLILPYVIAAQAPSIAWKTYIDDIDPVLAILPNEVFNTDSQGNIYIGGVTVFLDIDVPSSQEDIAIYKFDSDGKQLWRKQFGSSDEDFVRFLVDDGSGNILIVGGSRSCDGLEVENCLGDVEAWITRMSPEGKILKTKVFSGMNSDIIRGISILNDNSILIRGVTKSNDGFFQSNTNDQEHFIAKLSDGLELEWIDYYDGYITDFAEGLGGEIFACGVFEGDGDLLVSNVWIRKLNKDNGSIIIERLIEGGRDDYQSRIIIDEEYVYLGLTSDSANGLFEKNYGALDFFLVKLDYGCSIQWVENYGGKGRDGFNSLSFDKIGENVYLCGDTRSTDGDIVDPMYSINPWLIKVEKESGDLIWSKTFDVQEFTLDSKHILGKDGSIYLRTLAFVEEITIDASVPALVKLTPEIDCSEFGESVKIELFPNLIFNGENLMIRSSDLVGRLIDMTLVDLYGHELWSFKDYFFYQTEMPIAFGKNLSAGVYYLSIKSSNVKHVLPIVIVE